MISEAIILRNIKIYWGEFLIILEINHILVEKIIWFGFLSKISIFTLCLRIDFSHLLFKS